MPELLEASLAFYTGHEWVNWEGLVAGDPDIPVFGQFCKLVVFLISIPCSYWFEDVWVILVT